MFEFSRFVVRNPMYAMKNWRGLSSVRKAMNQYRSLNPACEWCGRDKALDVHHIIPVSIAPQHAGNTSNMMMLCRKPACHQIIGHNGDFGGRYVENAKVVCRKANVGKVVKNI